MSEMKLVAFTVQGSGKKIYFSPANVSAVAEALRDYEGKHVTDVYVIGSGEPFAVYGVVDGVAGALTV